ncbi:asparaginase domain-containing protein [uncultured Parasphingopyxis sp.]|uniref:asparaginase domain-containing protein n=1 Tax=uncultured Parasphingopyxis sp. TaxID=1547918 RepID=UPI0026240F2A|nr:asparaginase domain-containing protein [uncultured Parasphingopyxis sp.]
MKICVINTGGTISSAGEPLTPITAAEFGAAAERIIGPVIAENFPRLTIDYETSLTFPESETGTLDSTNLQPHDWCLIARFLLDNYARYDGFVVLHGTDSMDFTGSALPFLLNVFDEQGFGRAVLSKPVIITGSQVPMFHRAGADGELRVRFNTDAFQNFCGAIACAQRGIPEVGVYFGARLFRGNRLRKVDTSDFDAFDSPNYPPLAAYGIDLELFPEQMLPGPASHAVSLDNPECLALAKANLAAISAAIDDCPVMQFNAFPARYRSDRQSALLADLMAASIGTGLKGLVLESYGGGNFPSGHPDRPENGAIYRAIEQANADGVIVVDSTQVLAGTVDDRAYAAGAWLRAAGALSAYDMTSVAALSKAMILLAAADVNGWSFDTVKRLVQLNLAGEVRNVSWLNSRSNATLLPGQAIMALDGSARLVNDPFAGPLLQAGDGECLWSPFGTPDKGKAGRLVMQNDGNLVFYSDQNEPLWATDTRQPHAASSVLMLTGSHRRGDLLLSMQDYSGGRETARLFDQHAA